MAYRAPVVGWTARSPMLSGVAPSTIGTLEISDPVSGSMRIKLLVAAGPGGGGNPPAPCVAPNSAPSSPNAKPEILATPAGCPTTVVLPSVWLTMTSAPSLIDACGPLETPCPPSPPYRTGWGGNWERALGSASNANIDTVAALARRLLAMEATGVMVLSSESPTWGMKQSRAFGTTMRVVDRVARAQSPPARNDGRGMTLARSTTAIQRCAAGAAEVKGRRYSILRPIDPRRRDGHDTRRPPGQIRGSGRSP